MKHAVFALALIASATAAQAETIKGTTLACTSWAGWHEMTLDQFNGRQTRQRKSCSTVMPEGSQIDVIEGDDGAGAAKVRWNGQEYWIDDALIVTRDVNAVRAPLRPLRPR